jgi:hypothetical protein
LPPERKDQVPIQPKAVSFPNEILRGLPVMATMSKRVYLALVKQGKEMEGLIYMMDRRAKFDKINKGD